MVSKVRIRNGYWKSYMLYRLTPLLITLSDLHVHICCSDLVLFQLEGQRSPARPCCFRPSALLIRPSNRYRLCSGEQLVKFWKVRNEVRFRVGASAARRWWHCANYGRPMEYGRPLYFSPVVSSIFFFFLLLFFPRLISAAVDWMSAILPHMVWP